VRPGNTSQRLDVHTCSVGPCSVGPCWVPYLVDPCAAVDPCPAVREHRPVGVEAGAVVVGGDVREGGGNYTGEAA
jgi:hypothetical protein